jgi:hypothetical protein
MAVWTGMAPKAAAHNAMPLVVSGRQGGRSRCCKTDCGACPPHSDVLLTLGSGERAELIPGRGMTERRWRKAKSFRWGGQGSGILMCGQARPDCRPIVWRMAGTEGSKSEMT